METKEINPALGMPVPLFAATVEALYTINSKIQEVSQKLSNWKTNFKMAPTAMSCRTARRLAMSMSFSSPSFSL